MWPNIAMFSFRLEATLCRALPPSRGMVPLLRTTAAAVLIQARGKKQKFGGITRDPFKTFQKKLQRQGAQRHAKVPLKSEERGTIEMSLPINVASLGQVISDYVPPEKFAKAPLYTRMGQSQRRRAFKEGIAIIYSGALIRRRLRKVDPFRPIEFARQAQRQFIAVNNAIQKKDKPTLRSLATEDASTSLKEEFEHKRVEWKLVEELERPRIVSARVAPLMTKENLFAQVIVRMHTKQILALYDSAGRLVRGHPTQPKTVIDYIVFERHLAKPEVSSWRVASKIPPQLPWRAVRKAREETQQKALPSP